MQKKQVSLYRLSPDNYDAMMSTELEKNIFGAVADEIKSCLTSGKNTVLDLCCGTGIVAELLLDEPNIRFIGVDINRTFLESAKKKIKGKRNFEFMQKDARFYMSPLKFDVVVLTSAYHHIENPHKLVLLKKIYEMLNGDGTLVIYEKLISKYANEDEFAKSNEEFYLKRIEYLKRTERKTLGKKALDALMNVCALSASAEEEFKVDYGYLVEDLDKAGFETVKETKIWPEEDIFHDEKTGDFVFVAKKK
ncbi:MAG: class I SAM-dependent methyltransferase [Candidatus Diapherotrites archaeon]